MFNTILDQRSQETHGNAPEMTSNSRTLKALKATLTLVNFIFLYKKSIFYLCKGREYLPAYILRAGVIWQLATVLINERPDEFHECHRLFPRPTLDMQCWIDLLIFYWLPIFRGFRFGSQRFSTMSNNKRPTTVRPHAHTTRTLSLSLANTLYVCEKTPNFISVVTTCSLASFRNTYHLQPLIISSIPF